MGRRAQRQLIPHRAKPGNGADGNVGKIRVMPEGLSRVYVAHVHFDEGNLHRQQGIAQGDAGMRQRRGVEDDERDVRAGRFVNLVDQLMRRIANAASTTPTRSMLTPAWVCTALSFPLSL